MPVLEQQFNGTFNHADFDDPSSMIEALTGVRPELDPEYDLTRLAEKDRLQIRIDKNNAPKEMVIRFAEQMAYSAFPPIVVTADDRTVDGNTRVAAYRRRDQRFAPALVIPISYDDAEPEMQLRLQFLGHALNNSNGKTLDRVERRAMAREAIALGMSDRQIAQTTGFPTTIVAGARHEMIAESRMAELGIEVGDLKIADASLRALGRAANLNDAPFKALAELTRDAGLSAGDIKTLATSVRETGSDALGLERIDREREDRALQIADRKAGRAGKPPVARQLRQRLGFVLNHTAEALVERSRDDMAGHLEKLEQAVEVLNQAIGRQRELIAG